MRPRSRKWPIAVGVLVVAVAALLGAGYWATGYVPSFYEQALRETPADQRQAAHSLKQNVAALAGDALRPGQWQAAFTSAQINGFLAIDLLEQGRKVLPAQIHDPRVALTREGAQIGWRYDTRWSGAVYSVTVVPYIVRPNVLAVRIRSIRAGAVPIPLGQVVDALSEAARKAQLRLQWRQENGDPVAIIELPPTEDVSANQLVLDAIDLADGKILLAGHTERRSSGGPRAAVVLPGVRVADQSTEPPGENENRQ